MPTPASKVRANGSTSSATWPRRPSTRRRPGTLGKPPQIAKVLGAAAHAGHLTLAFARPEEQRLAEQLDIAQRVAPIHSDALAVTTSNSGGNKLDYYFNRDVDYRVMLHPTDDLQAAGATADLAVRMTNTAPDSGLPSIVIGPFDNRFVAGQNRTFLSLYSGLGFTSAKIDGKAVGVSPGAARPQRLLAVRERVRQEQPRRSPPRWQGESRCTTAGTTWWCASSLRSTPIAYTCRSTCRRAGASTARPRWSDRSPGALTVSTTLDKTTTYRVHIVRDADTWDLWQRLQDGT